MISGEVLIAMDADPVHIWIPIQNYTYPGYDEIKRDEKVENYIEDIIEYRHNKNEHQYDIKDHKFLKGEEGWVIADD